MPPKTAAGEVILDFSQVRPFEPLDSSQVYLCSISALTLGRSKEGGPKSSAELTIMGPDEVPVEAWEEDSSAPGGHKKGEGVALGKDGSPAMTKAKGRKLFREYSLQANALPFLYELLKAADPDVELNESFRYNPKAYVGLQVACKIQNEAYDEQVRARVKRILPASAYKG